MDGNLVGFAGIWAWDRTKTSSSVGEMAKTARRFDPPKPPQLSARHFTRCDMLCVDVFEVVIVSITHTHVCHLMCKHEQRMWQKSSALYNGNARMYYMWWYRIWNWSGFDVKCLMRGAVMQPSVILIRGIPIIHCSLCGFASTHALMVYDVHKNKTYTLNNNKKYDLCAHLFEKGSFSLSNVPSV